MTLLYHQGYILRNVLISIYGGWDVGDTAPTGEWTYADAAQLVASFFIESCIFLWQKCNHQHQKRKCWDWIKCSRLWDNLCQQHHPMSQLDKADQTSSKAVWPHQKDIEEQEQEEGTKAKLTKVGPKSISCLLANDQLWEKYNGRWNKTLTDSAARNQRMLCPHLHRPLATFQNPGQAISLNIKSPVCYMYVCINTHKHKHTHTHTHTHTPPTSLSSSLNIWERSYCVQTFFGFKLHK